MASSFLMLLDDITSVLDDVAIMTKIAAKKTVGVLGDDLALNAQQVAGVKADRELFVVWAVAKGSLLNKAILVPSALLISTVVPWAVTPLLMLGGLYLCFEGFEKIVHTLFHKGHSHEAAKPAESTNLLELESQKIKGAVRTDFILSAEIIVIALGTVSAASFSQQLLVLLGVSLLMTLGVYGLVAGIVKLDDLGFYLNRKVNAVAKAMGNVLIFSTPWLMRSLSIAGTVAMFLVGGSIIMHGFPGLHELVGHWPVGSFVLDAGTGLAAGASALLLYNAFNAIKMKISRLLIRTG